MEGTAASDRYVVISTDGHCGADVLGYKPYLSRRFHDEFDAWAQDYHDPWSAIDAPHSPDNRIGVPSFFSSLNWDSRKREALLDEQGNRGRGPLPEHRAAVLPLERPGCRNSA